MPGKWYELRKRASAKLAWWYLVGMILGTRNVAVAYTSALREASSGINESGVPTLCPLNLAEKLYKSSQRWESICHRAGELLSEHAVDVEGDAPEVILEEAKEDADNIAMSLP